tara:strand:+ start:998 stop:1759 length:762 start_codon:yes stop_codon:yes gene_type:complete
MRLKNKVAVITGGARGIGEATVRRFVEEGAKVHIFDILENEGLKLAKKLSKKNYYVNFIKVDIKNENEIKNAYTSITKETKNIDILINCAAIPGVNKLPHEIEVQDWDEIFSINVRGTFLCTKHVLPYMMKKKSGSIVNFSSIYALIGNNDLPPYHATKGAILSMTKTDAICYAKFGIRVNSIHPGTTKTELVVKAADTYQGEESYLDMMKRLHPLRLGEPIDVANSVLFLASDEAKFITGANLVVDGGYTSQ